MIERENMRKMKSKEDPEKRLLTPINHEDEALLYLSLGLSSCNPRLLELIYICCRFRFIYVFTAMRFLNKYFEIQFYSDAIDIFIFDGKARFLELDQMRPLYADDMERSRSDVYATLFKMMAMKLFSPVHPLLESEDWFGLLNEISFLDLSPCPII